MNRKPLPADLHLAHRAIFTIDDAAGVAFTCRTGSLWITLDHDARDIVLEAGGSFTTTEHRRAVIYAMESSHVLLKPASTERRALPARQQLAAGARVSHA